MECSGEEKTELTGEELVAGIGERQSAFHSVVKDCIHGLKIKARNRACFKERELHQGRGDCVSRAKNSALHAVGAHGIFAQ